MLLFYLFMLRELYCYCLFSMLFSIQFLRHLKEFFQVTFRVETSSEDLKADEDEEGALGGVPSITRETVTLSCVGVGYSNFSRGIM